MPGVILAVPDRPEAAPQVLDAAGNLLDLTGAGRVVVIAIRIPPEATILPSEEVLTRQHEERIRQSEQRRAAAMKVAYDNWRTAAADTPNCATEWSDVEGSADQVIADWGRRADFIVIRRPTHHETEQERAAFQAALFDSGRPVLVVPGETPSMPFGRRIAIAWRNDKRTAKAVLSGLRCLARAEEIHVIAGVHEGSVAPSLPDIFDEHEVAATLHVMPIVARQVFGKAVLDMAHRLGADMLVMGAFVHHPIQNLILGGMTRYMITHADIPVLMRH